VLAEFCDNYVASARRGLLLGMGYRGLWVTPGVTSYTLSEGCDLIGVACIE
jgi:hypothetical protein